MHNPGRQSHIRLLCWCLWVLALLACLPASATYRMRYSAIDKGGITFTGNTLGLSKQSGQNQPGTSGSIGAFLSLDSSLRVGTFPYSTTGTYRFGTTLNYALNGSQAYLTLPAGSTVQYAELIWSGYYADGGSGQSVASRLNDPVRFILPSGSVQNIAPDAITSTTLTEGTDGKNFYVRSANVTSLVQAAGAGIYGCGGVPAVVPASNNNDNYAGWTLAVVYRDTTQPYRNLTFWAGGEFTLSNVNPVPSVITGFCTPGQGDLHGRMLVTCGEGDENLSGDQMRVGQTSGALTAVSGPNNPVGNFFNSRINGNDGTLNTVGTAGTLNYGSGLNGVRQGWDITNVDIATLLTHSQNTAYAQGTTTGESYIIGGVALQIDVGAPDFTPSTLAVDKATTYAGDVLTFTTVMDNTTGTADAEEAVFTHLPPNGLSFIPGTVRVNGAATPVADVTTGVSVGTIRVGTSCTVVYQMHVDYIPPEPADPVFNNDSRWTFKFHSCPLMSANFGSFNTNVVITGAPRLRVAKSANPSGALVLGQRVTYTITVENDAAGVATSTATLRDPIPTGLTYVSGTTRLNGRRVTDPSPGVMPFSVEREIHSNTGSQSDGAGVILPGKTATITFDATLTTNVSRVTNIATIDQDSSSGPAPPQIAAVSNPPQYADLRIAITDGLTNHRAVAGSTYTYTLTITNGGPNAVDACNVIFQHPTALDDTRYTPSQGSYDPVTGALTGITLAANGSMTLDVEVQLAANASGSVTVTGTVSVPSGVYDANEANNFASHSDSIIHQADLSITKTDGTEFTSAGSPITYTITVLNNGPSSIDSIVVTDVVPAALQNPVFTASVGTYNTDNGMWTGVNLSNGQSVVLTLAAIVRSGASGTLANTATVAATGGVTDPNTSNNSATDTDYLGLGVVGTVYRDANHDATYNPGEPGTGITPLYAKIGPGGGGAAIQVATVNLADGEYQLLNMVPGTYRVWLSNTADPADTTPYHPSGWLGTEHSSSRVDNVVIASVGQVINFGLWHGSMIAGTVYADLGTGGGTANDGVQNGGELGRQGRTVRVTDAGGATTYDTTTTNAQGGYTLWIAADATGSLLIRIMNDANYIVTGATPGSTGGAFSRATDGVTFTHVAGTAYSGVDFGTVPLPTLTNDGIATVAPGTPAFFPHLFTAGTRGTVTFTVDAARSPENPGWSEILYHDLNGNGLIDATDVIATGTPMEVMPGQTIALIARVMAPDNAQNGATDALTLTADFRYLNANPSLSTTLTRGDIARVMAQVGLDLTKTVDKASARPGEVITYTITYRNTGGVVLHDIVINDMTPAYTTFDSAEHGPLPANLTGCTITAPEVGSAGNVQWTFSGTLSANSSGTVTVRVLLQ